MARHGNKIKLTLLVEPVTYAMLQDLKKATTKGMGVIVDKIVLEKCRNKEQLLVAEKRELAKKIGYIDEELAMMREDQQYKKQMEAISELKCPTSGS